MEHRMRNKVLSLLLVMILISCSMPMGFAGGYPTPASKSQFDAVYSSNIENLNENFGIDVANFVDKENFYIDTYYGIVSDLIDYYGEENYKSGLSELYIFSQGFTVDEVGSSLFLFSPTYNTTDTEITLVNDKIEEVFTSGGAVHSAIETGSTTSGAIKAYIDGLPNNPNSTDGSSGQVAYDLLFVEGGVCAAYADLGHKMLNYAGISNTIELGVYLNFDRTRAIPHAWNKIDTGTEVYNIDYMNNSDDIDNFTVYTRSQLLNGDIPDDGSLAYVVDASGQHFRNAYDNTAPSASVTYDDTTTASAITLTLTADDDSGNQGTDSGVEYVTLPDGTTGYLDSLSGAVEYEVTENGTYEFNVVDGAGNDTLVTANVTNIEQQTAEEYLVEFVGLDGSIFHTESVEAGGIIPHPAPPEEEGYSFIGWGKEPASDTISSDTVITAHYEEISTGTIEYSVIFKDKDGNTIETINVASGGDITPPTPPTEEGFEFGYWAKGLDQITDFTNITSDMMIQAKYVELGEEPTYWVTFYDHEGTMISESEVIYGDTPVYPENPTRDGYYFNGWEVHDAETVGDLNMFATYIPVEEDLEVDDIITTDPEDEDTTDPVDEDEGEDTTDPVDEDDNTDTTDPEDEDDNTDTTDPEDDDTDEDSSQSSGGSSSNSGGGSAPSTPSVPASNPEKDMEEAKTAGEFFEGLEKVTVTARNKEKVQEEVLEKLEKNEKVSNSSVEDKETIKEMVLSVVNLREADTVSNRMMLEFNFNKIKDENVKEELKELVGKNSVTFKESKEVKEVMDTFKEVTKDKESKVDFARMVKDKLVEKTGKKDAEVDEKDDNKMSKSVEALVDANTEYNFFSDLRAKTYVDSIADEEFKKEVEEVYNEIKEANKDIVLNPIERKTTPPVILEGKEVNFDIEKEDGTVEKVEPFIKEGRTMSSVRVIAEELGADVSWNGNTQMVTLTKGNNDVKMFIGETTTLVDGRVLKMDITPILKDSRTYLPARFVAEGLSSTVLWNEEYNTVFID